MGVLEISLVLGLAVFIIYAVYKIGNLKGKNEILEKEKKEGK